MSGATPYADVRETHSGVVLLVGERAYKLKKPVDLGFLDFTTVAARRATCAREVDLNRRIAPDVYLGVAELVTADGASEPLVEMRRMPEDRRLSSLVRSGVDVADEVRDIARIVADFHGHCRRGPDVAVQGSRDAILGRWSDSFAQLRADRDPVLGEDTLAEVERLVLRYLAGREALFAARIAGSMVVDGHGDLLADDIFCLPDGVRILDCLEFDDRLRHLDCMDDVACLAMDLEHLGASEAADLLLRSYREFTADRAPCSLVSHFLAYRAFVRAKVACVRAGQGDATAAGRARELAELTLRHLDRAAVTLVLVGGAPGTGKSTLAEGLAERLELAVLGSDRTRKELAGIDPLHPAAAGFEQGLYSPAWTERTYGELLRRAGQLLAMGESVVVDATWRDAERLGDAADLARRASADLVVLTCSLDEETAARRIAARHGVSDADPEVAASIRAGAGARAVHARGGTAIDTSGDRGSAVDAAVAAISAQRRAPARVGNNPAGPHR